MKNVSPQLSEPVPITIGNSEFTNALNSGNSLIPRSRWVWGRVQTERLAFNPTREYKGWQYDNKLKQIGAQT